MSTSAGLDFMTIERTVPEAGHIFRFIASNDSGSWRIRQFCDSTTIVDVMRRTWQRVETDLTLFEYLHRANAARLT